MKLIYEAYDKAGRCVRDEIEAGSASEAGLTLRGQGLFVTQIEAAGAAKPAARGKEARTGGGGRRLKNLTMLARQLHVLVSTGTPLVQAIEAVEHQTADVAWRAMLVDVRQRIEEGSSLTEAMERHPQAFDRITRSLVEAGETAGKLPMMLDRVAAVTRHQLHVRNSVIGAMIYPALLVTVSGGILLMLLMFVLPKFADLFEQLDAPLPATTQGLVYLGEGLLWGWWLLPLVPVALVLGARAYMRSERGREQVDAAMIRMPLFGKITRAFITARIIRLMGTLLDSYLPLLEVLGLVKQTVSHTQYRRLLEGAEEAVTRGEPIHSAFADRSLVDPSVYQAIRSGEASGKVGPLLLNLAHFLDEDNEVVLKSLASIIEPVILVVLGLLVGFVAITMFLPLFDLTAMTGAR
ncbi:MAG: type II secretion system F family protein [Phycisphaeraceae bacterium]